MKSLLLIMFLLLCLQAGWTQGDDISLLKGYGNNMHDLSQLYLRREASEDARSRENAVFDSDSLFRAYAELGYGAIPDELYYYYHDYVSNMSPERVEEEIAHMKRAAREYGSEALANEAELMRVMVVDYYRDSLLQVCNRIVQDVAAKAGRRGDRVMKIRAMNFEFISNFRTGHYAHAFRHAPLVEKELYTLTDELYTERREMFFHLGHAYMMFRDYPRGVAFLHQALVDTTRYFFDRSNIRARMELGEYYRTIQQPDSSDYFYRSVLTSRDMVKFRPLYDYTALVNLGQNLFLRGNYDDAIRYYLTAEDFAREGSYHSLSISLYTGLGESFLEKGDLQKAGEMIDSALVYIRKKEDSPGEGGYRRLYPLISKYQAARGNLQQSALYMDSTLMAERAYENRYNALVILRAEQELFDAQLQLSGQQIRAQRTVIAAILLFLFVIAGVLLILFRLYRKKQAAYSVLVEQSRQWAASMQPAEPDLTRTDSEDVEVMESIRRLIEQYHIYENPDLTTESLAARLGVTRNAISKAVNNTQEKNFSAFINDYRISKAIRLLSDPANDKLTVDSIAFDCGFSNSQTFRRVFRTKVGMSPAEFRRNAKT